MNRLLLVTALAACGSIANDATPDAAGTQPDAPVAPDATAPQGITVEWAKGLANAGADRIEDVIYTPAGSAIALARFTGTITVDGTTFTSGANGSATSLLVTRLDADGKLGSGFVLGGAGTLTGAGLVRDGSDNVYVAGSFSGTADFGDGQARTSAGGTDGFVARFNPSGALSWVVTFGSTSTDQVQGITLTQDNNIAFVGNFARTITLGSAQLDAGTSGSDALVAKLRASNGATLWAVREGTPGLTESARRIASDASGALIVAGRFTGPSTIGGVQLAGAGDVDAFVAKYRLDTGAPVWAVGFGGVGADAPTDVAVRADQSIVIAGSFTGSMKVPDGSTLVGAGGVDVYVLGLSSAGKQTFAGSFGGADNENSNPEIEVASNGKLVLGFGVGIAGASVADTPVGGAGGFDLVIAGLDTMGKASWARWFGGAGSDRMSAMTLRDDRLIVAAITSSAQLALDTTTYAGAGDDDGVLVQFGDVP